MEAISSAVIKEERIYLYGNKWVEDENEKEMGGKSYIINMFYLSFLIKTIHFCIRKNIKLISK